MKVEPNKSVSYYVAQIERSLNMSSKYSKGVNGVNNPRARKVRLDDWTGMACEAGVPDGTIDKVKKEFTRRHGKS